LVPLVPRRRSEEVHLALHMEHGKPDGQALMAADDAGPTTSRRLFVQNKASRIRFLIDTGTDLCVYPRSLLCSVPRKTDYGLSVTNGTPIATYGTVTFQLNLGLRSNFKLPSWLSTWRNRS
jgi:hypothetical protein